MEKKKVILELPCELIDKIDRLNNLEDRSDFISHLIEKQLEISNLNSSNESITKMSENKGFFGVNGEINLLNCNGDSLGTFDIDTLEGFENLTKKIQEISRDPAVQIRARTLF